MNFKRINKGSEVKLEGIVVDLEFENDTLKVVTLSDRHGGIFKIRADYGMSANVPEPPKMVKRWHVSGKLGQFAVSKLFKSEGEAKEAFEALDNDGSNKFVMLEVSEETAEKEDCV